MRAAAVPDTPILCHPIQRKLGLELGYGFQKVRLSAARHLGLKDSHDLFGSEAFVQAG